jgi:AAA15 family ATPase/GTPase
MSEQHLSYLHIQNFRPFEDLHIKDLKQINVITGKNNVGKTALMEAIMLATAFQNENDFTNALSNILSRRDNTSQANSSEMYLSLFTEKSAPIINLHINDGFIKGEKKSGGFFMSYTWQQDKEERISLNRAGMESKHIFILDNIFCFLPATFEAQNVELWKKTRLTPKKQQVIQILQVIEPKIIDFDISGIAEVLLEGEENPRPFKTMGEGANRLLTIALALVNAKDSILLIDELEIGLHYSIQPKVWEIIFTYAHKLNVQVFITTHSRDCIQTFAAVAESKKTFTEMANYIRLQRGRVTNNIVHVPYEVDTLDAALKLNIETR